MLNLPMNDLHSDNLLAAARAGGLAWSPSESWAAGSTGRLRARSIIVDDYILPSPSLPTPFIHALHPETANAIIMDKKFKFCSVS